MEFQQVPSNIRDLSGEVFGELVVLGYAGQSMSSPTWFCKCPHDAILRLRGSYLTSGLAAGCGCVNESNKEYRPKRDRIRQVRHGHYGTPTYKCWTSMLERCRGIGKQGKKYYFDKGVTVCDRWANSFLAFLEDMGERPGPEYSIDRKDSTGNYEPDNCRWATDTEQNRNRSNTILLTIDGITKPLAQWSEETGIALVTLRQRIRRGDAGAAVIRSTRQGHEADCNESKCTCSSRRKWDKDEVWQSLLKRWAGRTVTIKQIQNRMHIPQTEIVKLCEQAGFTIHPDPAPNSYPRFGRQTVHF